MGTGPVYTILINSPGPLAVPDGCLFPSQAVQPQAVTAQDISVGSTRDTEGEAVKNVSKQTQRQVFTGESLIQSSNPTCLPQILLFLALHQSLQDPGGICFSRPTAAFLQTPNLARSA